MSTNWVFLGIALKCFQCSSAEDPTCLDLLQNDTASPYYKDCEDKFGHKPILCRKTVYSSKLRMFLL